MNAVKELTIMDLKEKRLKYKNVPEYALPKTKIKTSTSNGLTQAIIKYLTLKGHFATRTTSAGRYLVTEKKWIPSTTKKGYPDITAIVNGKSIHVEVKVGKDKMSPDQIKVKGEIEKSGGLYFIAKDLDSFVKWFKKKFKTPTTILKALGV
jgi:hypothetical protein